MKKHHFPNTFFPANPKHKHLRLGVDIPTKQGLVRIFRGNPALGTSNAPKLEVFFEAMVIYNTSG